MFIDDFLRTPQHPTSQSEPSDYPNLRALASGCISGRLSEWPLLKPEARATLKELDGLRKRVAKLKKKATMLSWEIRKSRKATKTPEAVSPLPAHRNFRELESAMTPAQIEQRDAQVDAMAAYTHFRGRPLSDYSPSCSCDWCVEVALDFGHEDYVSGKDDTK